MQNSSSPDVERAGQVQMQTIYRTLRDSIRQIQMPKGGSDPNEQLHRVEDSFNIFRSSLAEQSTQAFVNPFTIAFQDALAGKRK